jgi:excisionase family DNA binding protein
MTTRSEQFTFDFDDEPDDKEKHDAAANSRRAQRSATLTVPEAARILGISRTTAYEAVRDGSLRSIRVRRRILIPRSWINDMLLGSTTPTAP